MKIYLIFLLWCNSLVHPSTQQRCKKWNPVPEASYNRDFTDITSRNANMIRPLGFERTTLKFERRLCFIVTNTGGNMRHVEIKWELQSDGNLCIVNNEDNNQICSSNVNFKTCGTVPNGAMNLTYTFFCSGDGCEGGDRLFWYRFVVESPMDNGGYDENWCSSRDSNYPSSLLSLPPSILPPTTTTKDNSAASRMMNSWIEIVILSLTTFLFNIM